MPMTMLDDHGNKVMDLHARVNLTSNMALFFWVPLTIGLEWAGRHFVSVAGLGAAVPIWIFIATLHFLADAVAEIVRQNDRAFFSRPRKRAIE